MASAREVDQEPSMSADAPVITPADAPALSPEDELTKRFLDNRKAIRRELAGVAPLFKVISVHDIPAIITSGILSTQSDDPLDAVRTYSKKGLIVRFGSDKLDAEYRMYYVDLRIAIDCADPVIDSTNGTVDWYYESKPKVAILQQLVW